MDRTPAPPSTTHHGDAREAVEIWNEFSQRWTSGFVAIERTADGVVIGRAGDGAPLAAAIPAERVRGWPAGHPHLGDQRVSVRETDTFETRAERTVV